MGTLDGVDQQQGHALLLLLGVEILGGIAEQGHGQVAGPVHIGIGAVIAGGPQEQPPQDASPRLALAQGRVEGAATLEPYPEPAILLPLQLVAESHVHRLAALDVDHGLHEPGPYAGGTHAAAGEIAGQQLLRMLTQKAVQPVHLARRAGKQHEPPLLQIELHLLERLAQLALDGLRAPQQPQVLFILHGHVPYLELLIQRRAEYHAAALQGIVRQRPP